MKVKLGDVCERGTSNLRQSDVVGKGGDYPIYGASGYIGDVDFYHQEKSYVAIVKDGAGIGRTMLCPEKSSVIGTMQYLLPKEAILPQYLYYVVKYMHLEKYFSGATIPHIYFKDYKNEQFNLDTLKKQAIIVKILGKCEEVIAARNKQLNALDELIQARFVEMFGDINVNPLGWDTYSLDECFEIASSKRILKSEWKTEGIPFLRVRDVVQLVTTGKIDNDFFVSEEFYATLKDSDGIPKQGDVLVSATSTLGKCYIVESGERFYFKDADVLRFRSKKNINPVFFVEQMKTQYIEKQIARTLGVTTVAHFTIKAAKTINMRLPPIELQNQFADFVNQVHKSKLVIKNLLQIYKHRIQM